MKKYISCLLIICIIVLIPRSIDAKKYEINRTNANKTNANKISARGFDRITKNNADINISNSLYNKIRKDLKKPVEEKYFKISSRFGYRINPFLNPVEIVSSNKDVLNSTAFHTGLDISGPNINWSNVYSVLDGTVKEITENNLGYGNFITIQHGSFETLYAHMSEIRSDLKEGSFVMAGEEIGRVGSTGRSTGPHLHIEFNFNNISIDPELFFEFN